MAHEDQHHEDDRNEGKSEPESGAETEEECHDRSDKDKSQSHQPEGSKGFMHIKAHQITVATRLPPRLQP
jgi:hypothetical protein